MSLGRYELDTGLRDMGTHSVVDAPAGKYNLGVVSDGDGLVGDSNSKFELGGSSGDRSVLKRPNARGVADRKSVLRPLFEARNGHRVASIRPNLELLSG